MRADERRMRRTVLWKQVPLAVALVVLWVLLWGEFTLLNVIVGVVLAAVIMAVFYLPPVDLSGRVNLWWTLRYLWYFFREVFVASFQVAFLALDPRGVPDSSLVEVRLRTRSDFIITMTGLTISLIPGSLVAEVDRFRSTLYLHVLNTSTREDVEAMRAEVLWIEELLIRAVGDRAEVKRLKR